ncbi:hypothetical protein [Microlunatus soli]|uniref:F5/8 type C domain-containing protein n=1 Tax=Microlunatus soli TaxID=630515 RepID=A0A1H1ZI95_9ACTN|nr:hypothetical protein [Microlunatus soli]SDT33414.1 hypothetical protein SAMN04489812_5241 [Microlunatus soli]
MRESQTAVLERGAILHDQLATEPFEVAWADQARWFVQFLTPDDAEVTITVQVSPDGLTWVDHEITPRVVVADGMTTVPVSDLGHWIRLVLRRTGGSNPPLTRIYLTLKE